MKRPRIHSSFPIPACTNDHATAIAQKLWDKARADRDPLINDPFEGINVDAIIQFGPLACGKSNDHTGVDLLVIIDNAPSVPLWKQRRLMRKLFPLRWFRLNIQIITRAERNDITSPEAPRNEFEKHIRDKGVVLHELA